MTDISDIVTLDVETRSTVDLRKTGPWPYSEHPNTDLWCVAWTVGEGELKTWRPGYPVPDEIGHLLESGYFFEFWNADFEIAIWINILSPRYGWPALPLDVVSDGMIRACMMGLPRSLEQAGHVMKVDMQKDEQGSRLMKQMAKPRRIEDDGTIVWWDDADRVDRLTEYCRQDVRSQRALSRVLRPLPAAERASYLRTLRANVRGIRVDTGFVDRAVELLDYQAAAYRQQISELTNYAVTAPTQVAEIKSWLADHGVELETLDKNHVADLIEEGKVPESVQPVIDIRAQGGKSSVSKFPAFQRRANSDGRIRGEFIHHGASKTGRFSGSGVQCVTGEHEVLTPEGWKRIDSVVGGARIMQWSSDGSLSWVDAPVNCYGPAGELAEVSGTIIRGRFTPDHRMPVSTGAGLSDTCPGALGRLKRKDGLVINGTADQPGLGLTDTQLRILVAFQADGGWQKKAAKWRFTKQRKIERLSQLLDRAGITYKTTIQSAGVTAFRIDTAEVPHWLCKRFDSWVLGTSGRQAGIMLEELPYWDGWRHAKNGAISLSSPDRDQIEWMATIASLAGYTATVGYYRAKKGGHWRIYVRSSRTTSVTGSSIRRYASNEPVYCPTTPGGYWLCRYDNRIFVTGNCHNLPSRGGLGWQEADEVRETVMNHPPAEAAEEIDLLHAQVPTALSSCLRGVITASEGYKLYCADYSNIEGRFAAWLAGEDWKLKAFREFDAGTGEDLYKVAASGILGITPGEVDKKMRNALGKVSELSLQFQGGVGAFLSMAKTYRVEIADYWDVIQQSVEPSVVERTLEAWESRGKHSDTEYRTWVAAEAVKLAWRDRHPNIVQAWYECENAMVEALRTPGTAHYACGGKMAFQARRISGVPFLLQRLPSGRLLYLAYPWLEHKKTPWGTTKPQVNYFGVESQSRKWKQFTTYGGDTFQSGVQGGACDIMRHGWANLEDTGGYSVLLNVHDELAGEHTDGDIAEFERLMCSLPDWAEGLPVTAEGYVADRYRKDD
ncbi:hypothetical protein [Kushneria phosphatilytica]|uniref:Uncharacterized protein n=1 Tax=Kushneria phosphatilytica TaxID=657387 RepID=A0A1S1NXI7_9GAMM|nr:hypothetical protein [Kushneria phosphatilytica]OHV12147.1 hypothetical protein BH688_05700 [Kushneria phosphatilytica]QEL11339.1 hypothetical protein FY550_09435 [Kushneria phosphatilytica]